MTVVVLISFIAQRWTENTRINEEKYLLALVSLLHRDAQRRHRDTQREILVGAG
jgi:hypothetical protein